MPTAKRAVSLAVGLAVMAIVASVMAPVAIDEIEGQDSVTLTTAETETDDVNGALNATLDDAVSGSPGHANYTLQTDSQSITKEIDNGTTATYSFTRGDVNVTVDNVVDATNATATYEYNRDFAFSDGARSLWGILGLAVVLAILLYLIGMALRAAP